MGSNTHIPASGSFGIRNEYNDSIYSKINRARVTEVNIPAGTIKLTFLNLAFDTEAVMPLIGLSLPPSSVDPNQRDYTSASWGRYIPQVGDIVLTAHSTDGDLHVFGYSTSYYNSYDIQDNATSGSGGIGWGKSSGKSLQPGDWDFKSSRSCSFYLGDKVLLASSNCSIAMNQNSQDITTSAPLTLDFTGSSAIRYGAVRRLVLPANTSEDYIVPLPSIPVRLPTDYAQEFTVDIRWGSGKTSQPPGGSLAYLAMGDVVDDLNPAVEATGYSLLDSSEGNPVRYIFRLPGATPALATYVETVDSLGNYAVETPSSTATLFKWSTPTAAWEVSNLSTDISSLSSIDMSALTMDFSATTSFTASSITSTLDSTTKSIVSSSGVVNLGADGATESVMKGLVWQNWVTQVLDALIRHFHPTPVGPTGVDPALGISLGAQIVSSANALSKKVFTK